MDNGLIATPLDPSTRVDDDTRCTRWKSRETGEGKSSDLAQLGVLFVFTCKVNVYNADIPVCSTDYNYTPGIRIHSFYGLILSGENLGHFLQLQPIITM